MPSTHIQRLMGPLYLALYADASGPSGLQIPDDFVREFASTPEDAAAVHSAIVDPRTNKLCLRELVPGLRYSEEQLRDYLNGVARQIERMFPSIVQGNE